MKKIEHRIAEAMHERFPNAIGSPNHFGELLAQYDKSNLSPPHLVMEIETLDEGKICSYLWEAMLYRHLSSMGYELLNSVTAAGQHGPDFCVNHKGQKIWIEAIAPSPEGIPTDWLEPHRNGEIKVKTKPDKERVLRCTSAIDTKQKKFAEYRDKGIVGENDCVMIAVNFCRLSDWDIDGNGISQLPLVMEAVFPIGPLGFPITREGKLDGPGQHMERQTLKKTNGSAIHTANFLDPKFANVSAVVQGHQRDMFEKDLVLSTVHNPLTGNPLPTGLFGVLREFLAEAQDNNYLIKNIALID